MSPNFRTEKGHYLVGGTTLIIPKGSLSSQEIEKDWKAIKPKVVGRKRDIIGSTTVHPSRMFKQWLNGLESIETRNIDKIRRPNPFLELLCGSLYPAIVDDMQLCIDNPVFQDEWEKVVHLPDKTPVSGTSMAEMFNPKLYVNKMKFAELKAECGGVSETTLRRFINSEKNKKMGYAIIKLGGGAYYIKNPFRRKIKGIVNKKSK